jgi:hypothetical protein
MDKLSEHAIRMLEIVDANDISVIGNRQLRDIARAVYDLILQVQMLKTELRHKAEPNNSEKPNDCETCKNWDIVNDHCYFIQECRYEPKDEPQTEDEILREQCRAFMGIVEQTDCAWKKGAE